MNTEHSRTEDRTPLIRSVYLRKNGGTTGVAYTLNVSNCGTCLITTKPIRPGETFQLYSRHLWLNPIKALAVWSRKMDDKIQKVGFSLCPDLLPASGK